MDALIQKGNFERCYHPEATELVKMRQRHGHDTQIGRRCSNILEMLDAGTAKPADLAEQVRELAGLVTKGDRGT